MIIMNVGGSLIVPDEVDTDFLRNFRDVVLSHDDRFLIVAGGGKTCRKYQQALKQLGLSDEDQDWLGIEATRLNAALLRYVFQGQAYPHILQDPNQEITSEQKVLLSMGYRPGWSTDYVGVLYAQLYGASTLINMTSREYVHTGDPEKDPGANL